MYILPVQGDVPFTQIPPLSDRDQEGLADMMEGGPLPSLETQDRMEAFKATQLPLSDSTTSRDRR